MAVHAVEPVVERDRGETVERLVPSVTVAEIAEVDEAETPRDDGEELSTQPIWCRQVRRGVGRIVVDVVIREHDRARRAHRAATEHSQRGERTRGSAGE
jgi:hypothetical protein